MLRVKVPYRFPTALDSRRTLDTWLSLLLLMLSCMSKLPLTFNQDLIIVHCHFHSSLDSFLSSLGFVHIERSVWFQPYGQLSPSASSGFPLPHLPTLRTYQSPGTHASGRGITFHFLRRLLALHYP
jgi:hypothetical protein